MIFRRFAFLALISSLSVSAFADEGKLTLDTLLNSVRKSYPAIIAAETERDRAAGQYRAALGEFDIRWKSGAEFTPEGYYEKRVYTSTLEQPLEFSGANIYGGYRRGTGDFADYEGKHLTTSGGELRAGLRLPLLRDREIDRRRASLASANLGVDLAKAQIEEKRIEITRQASEKYWIWVNYGRRLEIAEQLLKKAKERDAALSQRVKLGDLPVFELNDNQRNVLQREAQLVQSERDFQNASILLSLYYRNDSGDTILPERNQLPSVIPSPDFKQILVVDEYAAKALSKRPEPRAIKLSIDQTEVENRYQENQLQPRLDLNVEVSNDIGRGEPSREPSELIAGVNLEIPLQRRTAEGNLVINEARLNKLKQEYRLQKDRIYTEIADSVSAIINARAQVDITKREVSFAKDLEKGEREKFAAGDSTILFVNIREQATADSEVRELDALTKYHLARVFLRAALGEF
jgi:outer membrane protein TolC